MATRSTSTRSVPFWTDSTTGAELCEAPTNYVLRERDGEGWKETFKVGRLMCQKTITREQAIQLVTHGKTDLIEKFTSKKGRPFDAFLVRQAGRITWEFPPRKPREGAAKNGKHAPRKAKPPVDLTKAVKLSESKMHDGDLYQTEDSFVVAKPEPNGSPRVVFQLKRNLCGKEISAEDVERLVETGQDRPDRRFRLQTRLELQRLSHPVEGQEESRVRIPAALA